LRDAGISDIVVVIGFGDDKLKNILPEDIRIVKQEKQLGTGHAVNCARRFFRKSNNDILVACGDMPLIQAKTYRNLIKQHQKKGISCTVLSGIVVDPQGYGRIIRDKKSEIERIGEDKDLSQKAKQITEVNSGAYCFRARDLFSVLSLIKKNNKQKEYYLTDSVHLLVAKGRRVSSVKIVNEVEIYGVTNRHSLAQANRIVNNWIIDKHLRQGVTIIDPATTYIDIRVKIGKDTVIHPLTVIDGNVNIGAGCVIGPFAHLRDKSVIKDRAEIGNFVEVKKSIVGKRTKAKHLTYLGDTVLGEQVNIGAGTITANYDGKYKHRTVIRDKVFIGSNTTLVAPIVIGKGALTGAGSVVLRNRNIPANTIVVGAPARVLRKKK